jgi:hypothetical protein
VHPCGRHGTELIDVEGGSPICPICDAEAIDAQLARGESLQLGHAEWVIPNKDAKERLPLKAMTMRYYQRDIERAKLLAKERGIPYQRYLRQLLASALDQEEAELFGPNVGAHSHKKAGNGR